MSARCIRRSWPLGPANKRGSPGEFRIQVKTCAHKPRARGGHFRCCALVAAIISIASACSADSLPSRTRAASTDCRAAVAAFADGDILNGERVFWESVHDNTHEVDEALRGHSDGEIRIRLFQSVAAVELALHNKESSVRLENLLAQVCDDLGAAERAIEGS